MKIKDILFEGEYTSNCSIDDIEFNKITTSVDEIDNESVFVLLNSISFDANKIINYVIARSPRVIITEKELLNSYFDIPIAYTENIRLILPCLYSRFYGIDYKQMTFIGVTGTNGKTTTATMIKRILTYAGESVGFIGTGKIEINDKTITDSKYSMTTPDPSLLYYAIKEMEFSGCKFVVMEVSSHALYFDKVFPIPFDIAVFTNMSEEHIDFHKTKDEYFRVKMKLFKQNKFGIFNMDDPYSRKAYFLSETEKQCIGIIQNADIMARDVVTSGLSGSEYIYREQNRLFKVKLKIPGVYNIYNSMMAISAAIKAGVKPYLAKEAIREIEKIDGRFEIIHDSVTVIIDYAHTEDAMKNILKTINSNKVSGQKLTTVFGCGGDRYKNKRPAMAKITEKFSDKIIITTDNSRNEDTSEIIKDILEGFESSEKRTVITSRKSAIEHAIMSANDGDIIAVIGKGHEKYNIDKTGYHFFDEHSIIYDALKARNEVKTNNENKPCPASKSL